MRISFNKYYVAVENKVYSLTKQQWEKIADLLDNYGEDEKENTYKALEFIENEGKFEFELDGVYYY